MLYTHSVRQQYCEILPKMREKSKLVVTSKGTYELLILDY